MGISMRDSTRQTIKEAVRDLRRRQTPAESVLWEAVRNRKLNGCKFHRQHPIVFEYLGRERFLIADLYCHEARLVIELDGPIHVRQKDYDATRTLIIEQMGIKVVRFTNDEVLTDIEMLTKRIVDNLELTH